MSGSTAAQSIVPWNSETSIPPTGVEGARSPLAALEETSLAAVLGGVDLEMGTAIAIASRNAAANRSRGRLENPTKRPAGPGMDVGTDDDDMGRTIAGRRPMQARAPPAPATLAARCASIPTSNRW